MTLPVKPSHQTGTPPDSQLDAATGPLDDNELAQLALLLEQIPEPAQPLELSALDGYLCGVLLQPRRPAPAQWLSFVTDIEGHPVPPSEELSALHALVIRRYAELEQVIGERQWFDPWVMASAEDGDDVSTAVLPWITGFACAMENFPDLMAMTDPALVEPLGLLFLHFDPDDLEDAEALLEVIETLEPPKDLAEAVQDIVRALMLIADVSRPRETQARAAAGSRHGRPAAPNRKGSQTTRRAGKNRR